MTSGQNRTVRLTIDIAFNQTEVNEVEVDKVERAVQKDLSTITAFIQHAALADETEELKFDSVGAHAHVHEYPSEYGRCDTCSTLSHHDRVL